MVATENQNYSDESNRTPLMSTNVELTPLRNANVEVTEQRENINTG